MMAIILIALTIGFLGLIFLFLVLMRIRFYLQKEPSYYLSNILVNIALAMIVALVAVVSSSVLNRILDLEAIREFIVLFLSLLVAASSVFHSYRLIRWIQSG